MFYEDGAEAHASRARALVLVLVSSLPSSLSSSLSSSLPSSLSSSLSSIVLLVVLLFVLLVVLLFVLLSVLRFVLLFVPCASHALSPCASHAVTVLVPRALSRSKCSSSCALRLALLSLSPLLLSARPPVPWGGRGSSALRPAFLRLVPILSCACACRLPLSLSSTAGADRCLAPGRRALQSLRPWQPRRHRRWANAATSCG